jgi:tRNA A-37 threonylcarbamoyl transferase component Bud32
MVQGAENRRTAIKIPPDFLFVRGSTRSVWILRKGVPLPSDSKIWERWTGGQEGKVLTDPGGRAPVYRIEHSGVGSMVLRRYRHGGMFRWLLGDGFLGPQRFLDELSISETLRARGVPTPEVLALHFKRPSGHGVRGWILTRHIANGQNLRQWVESGLPGERERRQVMALAAGTIASLHAAGCSHRDLNLSNLLLASGTVFVLDLDGAKQECPLSIRSRGRNLLRLYRSLGKHTGSLEPLPLRERWRFLKTYAKGDPVLGRALWRFLKSVWGLSSARNGLAMSIRRRLS